LLTLIYQKGGETEDGHPPGVAGKSAQFERLQYLTHALQLHERSFHSQGKGTCVCGSASRCVEVRRSAGEPDDV